VKLLVFGLIAPSKDPILTSNSFLTSITIVSLSLISLFHSLYLTFFPDIFVGSANLVLSVTISFLFLNLFLYENYEYIQTITN